MTTPLRLAAVVAVLLVSGFTAERLASQDRSAAPPPVALAAAPVAASADSVRSLSEAASASLSARLPMGPVQGPISSPFGPRVHPVSGRVRHHDGVDLAVPEGTAVWTVAPGTVRSVGPRPGYGLVVEIDHLGGVGGAGRGEPVRTRYAHLASVDAALRPGLRVGRGVALGASGGRPGRDGVSTGAHLHFEVRDADGRPLDPARLVRLPEATSSAPRWTGPAAPTPDAGPPAPSVPDLETSTTDAEPDSLDAGDDGLPELVLPDYPDLPALTP
jgi:murein DD-endopeptidase MepM/ murein hydrolase activator NlpD